MIPVLALLFFFLTPAAQTETQVQIKSTALPSGGICAHRGAMDTHPENTLTAFREAIRLGVEMIEFDVRMTADGYLVILHDDMVDRTTNGHGAVSNMILSEVKQLDAGSWKSIDFTGERIPTLDETLSIMPETIWLNIHLKSGADIGSKTAKALLKANKINQSFLACDKKTAKAAIAIAPNIMICNMERQTEVQQYVDLTIELESDFIQFYRTPVGADIIGYVELLRKHHIKSNFCCTDDPEVAAALFKNGVDFVLVNQPDKMIKALDSMRVKY
jgi:glycerophosphoryl diester phosphodiesterase